MHYASREHEKESTPTIFPALSGTHLIGGRSALVLQLSDPPCSTAAFDAKNLVWARPLAPRPPSPRV